MSLLVALILTATLILSCTPNPPPTERGKDVSYQMHYIGTDYEDINEFAEATCISIAHFPTLIGPDHQTGEFNRWMWGKAQESVAITLDCLANPDDYEHYYENDILLRKLQKRTIVKLSMDTRGIYSGYQVNVAYRPGAATASTGDHQTFSYDVVSGRFLQDEDVFAISYDHALTSGLEEKINNIYEPHYIDTWLWMLSEEGIIFVGTNYLRLFDNHVTIPWDEVLEYIDWRGVMGEVFPEHKKR